MKLYKAWSESGGIPFGSGVWARDSLSAARKIMKQIAYTGAHTARRMHSDYKANAAHDVSIILSSYGRNLIVSRHYGP